MDTTRRYLDEIGKTDLLDAEAEVRLAQAIEAANEAERRLAREGRLSSAERARLAAQVRRGQAAREEFVSANLRLVVAIARRHQGRGVDLVDLIQEGNIGLMQAVERFDWRRGCRFSTYASWWIRRAVTQARDATASSVHVPSHVLAESRVAARTRAELELRCGRVPTAEEVAAACGLAIKQVRAATAQQLSVASLSAPAGEDGTELGDFLVDQSAPSPEVEAAEQAMREALRALVDKLPPRAAAVLRLRYGLYGEDPLTLEEIAARIGVSRERVRQLEQRALSNLRQDATSVVGGARSVA